MAIEICAVGGYNEVGRNMTAIRYGNEVVICDMGFYLPAIIQYEEEEGELAKADKNELIRIDALPDNTVIDSWKPFVKAIVLSHCHLDHIGAVPYIASEYDCPILGTPYTIEVLNSILHDERIKIPNPFRVVNLNSKMRVSENISVELIGITHSTPQSAMIAVHTPEGTVVYCNDYKFDNHPVMGKKPNYARLKELGNKGKVIALIDESLYAGLHMKTPSEKVAREMLKDVLMGTDNRGSLVVATTFASHIARLKSIIEFGRRMGRKVVLMGRSMHRYVTAAENIGLVHFSKEAEVLGRPGPIKRMLKQIAKDRSSYLIVCTGNQGEPNSMLIRMAMKELPFEFRRDDQVIFSCRTIPSPINKANRAVLEEKLSRQGVRIFKDIHVSGHASREDHRDLINMLKPKHIIPAHGDVKKLTELAELATSMGYTLGKDVHILRDGQIIEI
ncbi:MAG: RNase J family beta-CASP ribonuclease [Candidatus Woesearchaeota archaeon]